MSDTPETDTLLVYVRREVLEVVAFTVPLGWKPESHWDLVQILNDGKELPKHQWATWEPDVLKKWPDWWRIVEPGELVPSPSDAREIIAKMPRGYNPEELREFGEQGAKVWGGVPDAAQWVRDLRGGESMSDFSERDEALARLAPRAEEACPGFAGLARAFVISFLRLEGIATGEQITDAAKEAGIEPHDDRAFGGVFLSLSKRGIIERRGFALRRKGHNTPGASIWALK